MAILFRRMAICLPLVLASGIAAGAEPHMKPLANGSHHKFCDTNDDLFDADGLMICAPYNRRWPERIGYAVLGPEADRFRDLVEKAVATTRTITGREIEPSDQPDLVLYMAAMPQTQAQVQREAAARDLKLTEGDTAELAKNMQRQVAPGFFGGSWGRWEGDKYRRFVLLQLPSLHPPDDAPAEYAKAVRDGVFYGFSIETAVDEIADGCDYLGDEKYKPPPLLPVPQASGTGGLVCGRGVTLLKSGNTSFCADAVHWPASGSYAVLGPGAAKAAGAFATAAAHAKSLTGRDLAPGNPADMVLLFLDREPTEPELRAVLAQSSTKVRSPGTTDTGIADVMKPLVLSFFDAVRRADPQKMDAALKRQSIFDMWSQSCRTVRLEAIVRTDEPDETIRKDVDDMFLRFWGIEMPHKASAPAGTSGAHP